MRDHKQNTIQQDVQFFFCYDKTLAQKLVAQGESIITVARNIQNNRMFSIFIKTQSLKKFLEEYNPKHS